MPSRPILAKDALDRFYTNTEIAADLVYSARRILSNYSHYIEPSAGAGSFIDACKNVLNVTPIGLDIAPARDDIQTQDWFEYQNSLEDVCIIGNPPFGARADLAKRFIQHAIDLGTPCISFILPDTFQKPTLQKVFPSEWKLVHFRVVPPNSYTLDGEVYNVCTVFQVWLKNSNRKDLRWHSKFEPIETDFYIVDPSEEDADWFVMGAAPKTIKHPNEVTSTNRGYWIKCFDDKYRTRRFIKAIDWNKYGHSGVNGGVYWLTKDELLAYYNHEVYCGTK
jgi:hypothetical protein